MDKYNVRVHIRIRNESDLDKLLNMDIERYGFNSSAEDLYMINKLDLIIDSDSMVSERKLEDFVGEIVYILAEDCIVIADTNCTDDEEACEFYVCYFGEDIFSDYAVDVENNYRILFCDSDIGDYDSWFDFLEDIGIELSEITKDYIRGFDINC